MTQQVAHFDFLQHLTEEYYEDSWPLPCEPVTSVYQWTRLTPDQIEQGDWTAFGSLAAAMYDSTSLTLECFAHALTQYITHWLDDNEYWPIFEYLYPAQEVKILATTDMIPWDALIAFSWSLACESTSARSKHWNLGNFKCIYNCVLDGYPGPHSEWAAETVLKLLLADQECFAVFLGEEPHVNQRLCKLAAAASYLTDTSYWQIAKIFGVLTTAKHQKQLPNEQLSYLWNLVVDLLPSDHPQSIQAYSAKQRHFNNKGNSMEALLLLLFEKCSPQDFWTILMVMFYMQYQNSNYSWTMPVC